MKSRMIKNTGAYMVVGMAPYIVNFFMLPVYTRCMDPADYGIVALVNALTAFIGPFVGLKLGSSLSRYYFDYDERGVREFFSTILYAMLAINILLVVLMHFAGDALVACIFRKADIPYYPHVFLGVLAVVFSGFAGYFCALLRAQERGGTLLAVSLVNVAVLIALGLYLVVYRDMEALGILLAGALAAAHAVVLGMVVRGYLVPTLRLDLIRKGAAYGLPVIPHALGRVLFALSDRLILGFFVPVASIGLYSIADRVSGLLGVGVQAFDGANQPNFMRLSKRSKDEAVALYRTLITKWAVAIAFTYLVIALFAKEVLQVLTAPQYHEAHRYVPILLGGFIFQGLYYFCTTTIMYEKKTWAIPLITLTAGGINIGANLLLIPRFGVMAAAWTTLAAFALTFVLALCFSNHFYPLQFEWKKLARILGTMLVVVLGVYACQGTNPWANAAIKLAGTAVFAVLLLKWNDGNISSDLMHLVHYLRGRLLRDRTEDS